MNALTSISQVVLTMNSREIAELVESRHDSVKRSMETLRDKGIISFTQSVETSHDGAGARPVDIYLVNKRDSYVVVAQLSPEFTARLVDRWQELESNQPKFDPATLTRSDILRLALESEEGRIKAEAERDQAIATKVLIGSKREASAMATASAAVRQASKLKVQLSLTNSHATVRAIEKALNQKFDWKPLGAWCAVNQPEKRYAVDELFGQVRTWPAGAWLAAYGLDIAAVLGVI